MARWAQAVGDPAEKWIALGLGDDWDSAAVNPPGSPPILFTHPNPPQEVLEAIAEAPDREAKVQVAWDYMRRPELKLRFGAYKGDSTGRRVAIIRHYERATGVKLLPPEVI